MPPGSRSVVRRWGMVLLTVAGAVGLWFAAVDRSWFVEDCPDCGLTRHVVQERAFGRPVRTRATDPETVAQRVARDLGVPCGHPRRTRWHKHRRWGLLACWNPCFNGTDGLWDDPAWYGAAASAKVAALVEADPDLPAEYRRRVLGRHDYALLPAVLDRAGVERPAR